MEIIRTTAPIPVPVMVRKFKEDIHFEIDYANCRFKGKTLITYLSNLDVKCSLILEDEAEALALALEYMTIPAVVNLPELTDIVMNLMLAYQGKPNFLSVDVREFINANEEVFRDWTRRINSLPLFAIHCVNKDPEYVASFPKDESKSISGINFVQLIKHPLFALLLQGVSEKDFTRSDMWFTEYVFSGFNLYHYFAVPENPLFVGLVAILDPHEDDKELLSMVAQTQGEVKALGDAANVPLI